MRTNFAQVLKNAKIDLKREYQKLYRLLYNYNFSNSYSRKRYYDILDENFNPDRFNCTSLDLNDFNIDKGFHFVENPQNFDIEYLVRFCEYLYNLNISFNIDSEYEYYQNIVNRQILKLIELIGYVQSFEDSFTIFVEKDPAAISVSEILPEETSYKVISYNHHSMKGDLEAKRSTILQLANLLESKRSKLKEINPTLEDNLFFAFNNLNIRHNNVDISDDAHYHEIVANMSKSDLEKCYDDIYQMCLIAFLEIEQIEVNAKLKELKKSIKK